MDVPPPPPPPDAVPSFLVKLLEACTKHKRRHERETTNDASNNSPGSSDRASGNPVWCHSELKSFARILPRLEATITVRNTSCDEYHCSVGQQIDSGEEGSSMTTNNRNVSSSSSLEPMKVEEDSLGHLCALYRAIARGAFCPYAFHYLFVGGSGSSPGTETSGGGGEQEFIQTTDGDIAEGILSRITKLLQHMASDPVRMALSPLPPRPKIQGMQNTDEEAIKMHHQEEGIGSTIAALLNLLQDYQLQLCAVHDLINLSNDLSVIGESNVLFDPPVSTDEKDGDDVTWTTNGDKIRVQVFTEIARCIPNKLNERYMICVPSRRSLLAIQLGVWTALHRLIPKVIGGDVIARNSIEASNVFGPSTKISLMNSLLSASRLTSFVLPRTSHRLLDWTYSSADVEVHSLLTLRTKLAIMGLFTDIIGEGGGFFDSRSFNHDAFASTPRINLALMAVDAAKYHLLWNRVDCSESSLLDGHEPVGVATSHLSSLNSMCSWAISNFLALALLFPHTTSTSTTDIWSYCFPSLIDCIPLMTDPSNTCLRAVMVQSIHAILSVSVELGLKQPTQHQSLDNASKGLEYPDQLRTLNTPSFLEHLRNRCLVRGYFSFLFKWVQDSATSISGPAIAIVALLLENSSVFFTTKDLLETTCSRALGSFTPLGREDTELPITTHKDSSMLRLGSKRRKLISCKDGKEEYLTSSIESAFAHAISDALADARDIMKNCSEEYTLPISPGAELVTLVSESDVNLLRSVAGALRILMSLQCGVPKYHESCLIFTDATNAHLFDAIEFMSMKLVRQKSNGKLVRIEPKLLYDATSLIVSTGLHACRVGLKSTTSSSSREAMTSCALSTLPMIESDLSCELRDDECPGMITKVKNSRLCRGCCRLASMFGAIAVPYSEVCLCGFIGESNCSLAKSWGDFVLDNTLPLQCR
jgi:hypothetical protein